MDAEAKPKICGTCSWWLPNRLKEPDPLARKWCLNPEVDAWTEDDHTCRRHLGADATEVNTPNHLRNPTLMEFKNATPVDGPTEILIVTYSKDFPWLEYALKAINRFCRGFQGVTVAHPSQEIELFAPLVSRFGVRLHAYHEIEGKGFLQHEVKMAEADLFLPAPTKYVLHCDADCIYRMHTTPENYFLNNKPVYLIRTWESLTTEDPNNPGSKIVSDCQQWKIPTDAQLGFDTPYYTMCMNTSVFPIDFYAKYRAHIENVQRKPFEAYMMSGKNSFAQDRMDWTACGAFALRFMQDRFHWIDVCKEPYPEDRKRAYWSHGGISPAIKTEIEGMIRGSERPETLE